MREVLKPYAATSGWAKRKTQHETPVSFAEQNAAQLVERGLTITMEGWFSFAFVRNPWDRFLSLYAYLDERCPPVHAADFASVATFADFADMAANGEPWLMTLHSMRPQTDFLDDTEGRQVVDFIGRYETLERDFASITKRLNLDLKLPHQNASSHLPYRDAYDARTRDKVAALFAGDIDRLEYRF